jgi:CheY-like chemotaxis protein
LSAVRLIDFVNKRGINPQTKGSPIIPTVVLLTETSESNDVSEHLRAAGGATKVLRQPITSKDLLYDIMDVLCTQKKVDDTFKLLTKKKVISSKYPYMPIFDKVEDAVVSTENDAGGGRKMSKSADQDGGSTNGLSVSIGGTHHENRIEEVEDVSECSSLLPDYVKRHRQSQPELNSPYKQQRLRAEAEQEDNEEERAQAEAQARLEWRNKQAANAKNQAGGEAGRSADDLSLDSNSQQGGDQRQIDFMLNSEEYNDTK